MASNRLLGGTRDPHGLRFFLPGEAWVARGQPAGSQSGTLDVSAPEPGTKGQTNLVEGTNLRVDLRFDCDDPPGLAASRCAQPLRPRCEPCRRSFPEATPSREAGPASPLHRRAPWPFHTHCRGRSVSPQKSHVGGLTADVTVFAVRKSLRLSKDIKADRSGSLQVGTAELQCALSGSLCGDTASRSPRRETGPSGPDVGFPPPGPRGNEVLWSCSRSRQPGPTAAELTGFLARLLATKSNSRERTVGLLCHCPHVVEMSLWRPRAAVARLQRVVMYPKTTQPSQCQRRNHHPGDTLRQNQLHTRGLCPRHTHSEGRFFFL